MKRIAVLGSTGSIGRSTLDIVRQRRGDFQVVALSAGRNAESLVAQAREFRPSLVSVARLEDAPVVQQALPGVEVVYGGTGACEVASHPEADVVIAGIVGGAGLAPALEALHAGKTVGIANKEPLVMAGHIMTEAAHASGGVIIPVDSEHNALYQGLLCGKRTEVERLILTASGGAARDVPLEALENLSIENALKHPNWDMGRKITVDSATMMNKALEVIEAYVLFGLPGERVDAVLHPQSLIHSMVEYVDGSIMAQLSVTDMRLPIQFALDYPERAAATAGRLDLLSIPALTFAPLDPRRYPCFPLAYEVLRAGNGASIVFNAANESAVEAYLAGRISFGAIHRAVAGALQRLPGRPCADLEEVLALDRDARAAADAVMAKES